MKNIFVSSTFKDFQWERDILHDRVLPFLNEEARSYGESVSFCDLRWGIDTSNQESVNQNSAKVLSVCMNEIDRARPYMIVLLGERYGFIPGEEAIAHEARRKNLILQDMEISVTALEVEYGSMQNQKCLENTWFYFREFVDDAPEEYLSEGKVQQKKMKELKERILRVAGNRVHFYHVQWKEGCVEGLEEFAKQVESDLLSQLRNEWQVYRQMNPYQREVVSQWNYLTDKLRGFSVFEDFAKSLCTSLVKEEISLAALIGPTGSGKSTMLARICQIMKNRGFLVFPFFGGNSSISTDAFAILKNLVWQMEELLGWEHFENLSELKWEMEDFPATNQESISVFSDFHWRKRLEQLCIELAKHNSIFIAVDALDQLQESQMRDGLGFLTTGKNNKIHCLVTCLEDYTLPLEVKRINMPVMSVLEQRQVISSLLAALGKELPYSIVDTLLSKSQAGNPLYLYLAISRLCLMDLEDFQAIRERGDGMDAIISHQLELIDKMPIQLETLSMDLIQIIGQRIDPIMSEAVFRYLAVSRHGLRLKDLETLLEKENIAFSALTFAQLINYMNELFILRSDGRYDFLHKSLRQGILEELTKQGVDLLEEHKQLSDYLFSLPDDDEVLIKEGTWESMMSNHSKEFAIWMTHVWKNTDVISAVAKDIAAYCRNDNGQWLISLLNDPMLDLLGDDVAIQICFLVVRYFLDEFGDGIESLHLKINLAQAATLRMEKEVALGKKSARQGLVQCTQCLGELLAISNQIDDRQNAILVLEKSKHLIEELMEETGEYKDTLRLSDILVTLANVYFQKHTREGYFKAEYYSREALSLLETADNNKQRLIVMCNACMKIAQVNLYLGSKERLITCYPLINKGIEILKEHLQKQGDSYLLINLSKAESYMALLCMKLVELGDESKCKESLSWAISSLDLAEEGNRLCRTTNGSCTIAIAWSNLARAYQLQSTEESYVKAIHCAKKSVELNQKLFEELGTVDAHSRLVNAIGILGNSYDEQGQKSNALEMYLTGTKEAEFLVHRLPIEKHYHTFFKMINLVTASCLDLREAKYLCQGAGMILQKANIIGTCTSHSKKLTEVNSLNNYFEKVRKLCMELIMCSTDEERLLGTKLGIYYISEVRNQEQAEEAAIKLYSFCEERTQTLLDTPQKALPWVESKFLIFEKMDKDFAFKMRAHLAATYRDHGFLLQALGKPEDALVSFHRGLDILNTTHSFEEQQLYWNICTLGNQVAECCWPEEDISAPERLFFAEKELQSLITLLKIEKQEVFLERLNLLSGQLGHYYRETDQKEKAMELEALIHCF